MGNRAHYQDYAQIAGADVLTTISLAVAPINQKLVLTHITVVNDTTAMDEILIQKIVGADTVTMAQEVGPTLVGQTYWYINDIICNNGEHVQIKLSGTLLNDVIRYYVDGYYESNVAWETAL